MTTINIRELKEQAGGAGDDGAFERFEPAEGTYRCEIINANGDKLTANNFPQFGFFAKVLEGEEAGNAFWFNLFLSANASANNRTFGALAAMGIEDDTLDAGPEAIAEASVGAQVDVTVSYQPSKKDPTKQFLNVRLKALSGGGGWTPPTDDGPPAL